MLPFLAFQEQGMVGMPRQAGGVQPPHGGPGGVPTAGPNGAGPGGYLGNQQQQQQAAMMKQMMAVEQEKRVQLHLMEQQKVQLLREQRQQQHHHLLAEQVHGIYPSHTCPHFPQIAFSVKAHSGRVRELV